MTAPEGDRLDHLDPEDPAYTYTAAKPPLPETPEQLRARIPGWGVDLDPADRPAFPRERFDPDLNGAHWEFPERQPERLPRERSIEHAFLTPVFGTATPLKGVSGAVRRYAYRYGEARTAHWLLLIAADRVDSVEETVRSFASRHPDDPVTETGVLAEATHGGLRSRFGRGRADVHHQVLDPVVVAAPWVVGGVVGYRALRALVRRVR
ncbi:hypothetical protein MO973_33800 [Paenibacillus sp. TRM 82003]|uniref:hypothetical protein n=1 Tax=Kineococcus sp. TRM81007 TaxID=2925831 RepID=UPI001F599A92|nr:hypothetical protein [Kineococcus sp. TRM81007]MCI2240463.1 hypothetical protein [Kineococcus sp. TRM81007]MCI3925196.1 hypothetical protein [Paenibacillus sp. TRM 82003]